MKSVPDRGVPTSKGAQSAAVSPSESLRLRVGPRSLPSGLTRPTALGQRCMHIRGAPRIRVIV
jgi:hypothetical protein